MKYTCAGLALIFSCATIARAADDAAWARPQRFAALEPVRAKAVAQPVLPQVSASDEQRVAAACASPARILIIDNFLEQGEVDAYMDVDGDGKPDVGHGDVVSAVYFGAGKATAHLNLRGDGSIANVAALFELAAEKVEKGELKLAGINLSQSVEVPLPAVARDLNISVQPSEFGAKREFVNEALIRMMDEHDSPEYGQLSRAVARLAARGVPLFVVAGNGGPDKVNLLSFLPGAITVGGLARDGSKSPSSGDNALVSVWRANQLVLRRTADGNVDVNGDGVGDFDKSKLTGGATIASRFSGQPVKDAVIPTPKGGDFDILSRETPGGIARLLEEMPDKLYRTEDLIRFFQREGQPYSEVMRRQAPYYDKTMSYPFRADKKGRIVFDPAKDGTQGQVGLLSGTSFAVAAICYAP